MHCPGLKIFNAPLHLSHRYLFTLDMPEYWENKCADQTLEVLMSDLDPAIMDQFYMKDGVSASEVTRVSFPPVSPSEQACGSSLTFVITVSFCSRRWVEFVTWFQVLWLMPQCSTLVDTRWTGWRLTWVASCFFIIVARSSKSVMRLCSFSPQGTYWTIHITPEPEFSYVSFETNLSQTSYDELIRKVVEVFKPGKFVTTLFVNQVHFKSNFCIYPGVF